jgi:hypothetical protein
LNSLGLIGQRMAGAYTTSDTPFFGHNGEPRFRVGGAPAEPAAKHEHQPEPVQADADFAEMLGPAKDC